VHARRAYNCAPVTTAPASDEGVVLHGALAPLAPRLFRVTVRGGQGNAPFHTRIRLEWDCDEVLGSSKSCSVKSYETMAGQLQSLGRSANSSEQTKAGKKEVFGKVVMVKAKPATTVVKAYCVSALKKSI